MKRLLLISPIARSGLVAKDFFFRLPVLGLLKVAALTPEGWDVTIIDEKVESVDLSQEADLIGITAMTPTANRAYEIADAYRRRGIKVVMGGMHPSSLPEEALAHCDSVVVGEAENLLPLPDWERYRSKGYLPVHFLETTRGCPLDCEFCAVTNAFGGRYRNRQCDEVIAELRGLRPFDGLFTLKNCVFFVDDNIISNRVYAREFLGRIADLKLKWFGQASMNIARDDEILKLCQRSGCVGLFIGFESLSSETLREMGKPINQPQQYLESIRRIHDHGIGIDGSFVFGFDTDDEGVFDRTLEFVLEAKLEVGYYSILTPFPGTRLHARLQEEGRILTRDWSLYDTSHVVYRPRRFTPEQLLEGYCRVLKETYTVRSVFHRLWGTTAYKNFFYPMNYGFRGSALHLWRTWRQGGLRLPAT
jgi:radical SAM superfamily enzyme YgiQ (UPF0313 family)